MAWNWSENDSPVKPVSIDDKSSRTVVYVRKNFEFVEPKEPNDEFDFQDHGHWRYLEEIVKRDQWSAYQMAMQNSADLEYLAMEMGVDLDE